MSDYPESFPPSDDGDEHAADPQRRGRDGDDGRDDHENRDDQHGRSDEGHGSGDTPNNGRGGTGGEQNGGQDGENPFEAMLRAMGGSGGIGGLGNLGNLGNLAGMGMPGGGAGGFDPQMLGMMFTRIGQLLSYDSGPVNWELAREMARSAVAGDSDPSPTEGERRALTEAVRLAELWLDDVTTLPAGTTTALPWSRAEWIEQTLPVWKQLVEPVAEHMGTAMGSMLPQEGMEATPLTAMFRQIGGAIFGGQLGQGLASLASEVVSSTDVGLPLGPVGKAALLPANIVAFGGGLGVPDEEVRLYLALREAAYHRLFAHVPWLRGRVLGVVEEYARGIRIDESRLTELASNMQEFNPEALQELMSGGGLFGSTDTPEQQASLARLETLLALTEGWVDAVVHAAAKSHLPHAEALRETLRRRRAAGGPAEQTFSALVGLQLRPRRLRDAARLWASLTDARGVEGRDAVWSHPDLLPTPGDLDDPDGFVHREDVGVSEFMDMSELENLMRGGTDEQGEESEHRDDGSDEGSDGEDGGSGDRGPEA